MTHLTLADLSIIYPELLLAGFGLLLLIFGVLHKKENPVASVSWLAITAMVSALVLILFRVEGNSPLSVNMTNNDFTDFMKILVLIGASACLALSIQSIQKDSMAKFEYPMLILFAVIGMMIMISANDMLSLYVGLELQSLSLYVMAAFRREHVKSAESGMKYFILGAISSGMLLYGISMVYGFAGTVEFSGIKLALYEGSLGASIGFVFILAALAFKISAVPFHMWTPDVYEGAPTPVTAFFAIVPKIAALSLIVRVLMDAFPALSDQWFQILWLLSALSMAVGAFAGLRQNNIKRLLAYSSIGNMGYALIGVMVYGSAQGIQAMIVYLAIYMVMTIGVFGLLMLMRRHDIACDQMDDLAGLSQNHPWLAYPMAILMFSMSGIPPMAGFFGKLMIFQAAVGEELYILAIFGILTSVVAAYYYLRIIKTMFFDEPALPLDPFHSYPAKIIIGASIFVTLTFILMPTPLILAAQNAAVSLF